MKVFFDKLFLSFLCFIMIGLQNQNSQSIPFILIGLGISLLFDLITEQPIKIGLAFLLLFLFYGLMNSWLVVPFFLYLVVQLLPKHKYLACIGLCFSFNYFVGILNGVALYLALTTSLHTDFQLKQSALFNKLNASLLNIKKSKNQLENERLKNIETATLSERNRIAHQLHDSIGHVVSSSIIQVEAIKATTTDEHSKNLLQTLSTVLQNGMTDIRETLHQLYDDSFPLESKFHECFDDLAPIVKIHYSVDTPLSVQQKIDVYSILKEMATNFKKHSNGNTIRISFIEQTHVYSLSYFDNGTSFLSSVPHGIGLASMKDYVANHHGTFTMNTKNGFTIHLTLPKQQKGDKS